ncbi:MAG: glycosyltransferase 87 family protein [Actinobacteria bacterium]|nr:glycosyltransferase 87 family protein [Actinomycetota bacterium]
MEDRHGDPADAPRPAGRWRSFATPDRRILLLSIVLQLAVALLFGHSYDTRVFMGTGYLVGTGQNPYVGQDLSAAFHHLGFRTMTTVGYPPPWPLALGLIYRVVHAVTANILVYNLAIKLPVIAANVGLAYLVGAVLKNLGAAPAATRKAWVFLLLNPFLLYFGAAWGQIDALVALGSLGALVLLTRERKDGSAGLLALSMAVKPTALPILPAALVYLAGRSLGQAARYAAVFAAGVLVFALLPFAVFGWDPTRVLRHLNAHFMMTGTMSFMTVVRLFRDPLLMQGHWWLLGLLWIPALAVATVIALRHGVGGFDDLVARSIALVLVFFLTRTWLAEPNVILILPLVLILTSLGELKRRALTAIWVIPLLFTVFNASPLQLLFVTFPDAMQTSLTVFARYESTTLVVRAALVLAWQLAGWWIVVSCLRRERASATGTVRWN